MFTAQMFNVTKIYSTQQRAENELAYFISSRLDAMFFQSEPRSLELKNLFRESFQREDYAQALLAWNDYVRWVHLDSALYRAVVKSEKVDDSFASHWLG